MADVKIRLTYTPTDATVWIDGYLANENFFQGLFGPGYIEAMVEPGEHIVKISKAGYETYEKGFSFAEDFSVNVSLDLAKITINFMVHDEGTYVTANISVNGVNIGTTTTDQSNPLSKDYNVGDTLNIIVSKTGYAGSTSTVTIGDDFPDPYGISLSVGLDLRKQVRFESTPPDAEVYVDTVLQGTTALGLYMLPKDNYDIKITKTGYEDHIGTLSVHADDPDPIVYAATLQEEVPETFTISFVVVDTNNNPVSGATIRIQDTSGNTVETLTTDSAGAASASLQDANYDFYLSKTGYTWTDTDLGWTMLHGQWMRMLCCLSRRLKKTILKTPGRILNIGQICIT